MDPAALVDHYRMVAAERMQGLPIVNERLAVEAVGFFDFGQHRFGVLIAPWFMNMVLLPGGDAWSGLVQGDKVTIALPAGEYEFTMCADDALGRGYLSAVLFRTMIDFPDQSTAREVALDILLRLFDPSDASPARDRGEAAPPRVSRRDLLRGRAAPDA